MQSHYYENHMSNYWVSTPADDQRQVHKTCGMHCQRLQPTYRGIATFVIVNVLPNGASDLLKKIFPKDYIIPCVEW